MKYLCKTLTADAGMLPAEFLSSDASHYLEACADEIYADWGEHFPSEKSLAGVLSRTLLSRLQTPGFVIDKSVAAIYGISRAFHHQSSTSDLWVEIYEQFNHKGITDFLIVTQTAHFKEKFLYDGATMTIDSLAKHYAHFVRALKLTTHPQIYFLALDDLDFRTDVLVRGKKKFVRLERN